MVQAATSKSADSDRAELENAVAALARNPRLAKLLEYIGERYFRGLTDEITEYNIATDVFGRSKTSFDASRDSIARVEAYRLRKKLKEYYESDGKDHEVLISIPSGTYVPVFARRVAAATVMSAPDVAKPELSADSTEAVKESVPARVWNGLQSRTVLFRDAAIALLLLAGLGLFLFRSPRKAADQVEARASQPPAGLNQSTLQNSAQIPLRLLAGYAGSPRIDSADAYWQADRFFQGGAASRRLDVPVAKTSDPMLFEHWRTGDFTYDIPVPQGPYELHLYFVGSQQDDFKTSFFNMSVNGVLLLKGFNINADALGPNIADERVFKDIYPDKDGFIHLKFYLDRSSASLNALELLPGVPHRQLPVRLVMQRTAVTDHSGNLWHPDNYFQNGTLSDQPHEVSGTPDPGLYASERYGHFTYSIPVDTRGRYTLVLHFAELYWVSDPSGSVGVGSRVFRVYCNGSTLLDNFDVLKEAGSARALIKTFYHLRPSPEGKLDLTFDPIANYATISGIEVIDESD